VRWEVSRSRLRWPYWAPRLEQLQSSQPESRERLDVRVVTADGMFVRDVDLGQTTAPSVAASTSNDVASNVSFTGGRI
jgi:hypothetical protein